MELVHLHARNALLRRFDADGPLSEQFSREGTLRHTHFRAGRWRDNIIYSVLRAEVSLDQF